MKKPGCYFYLEKERNKDLLIAFNKLYEESNTVNAEFYEKLSQSQARRFWVSEERAAIVRLITIPERNVPKRAALHHSIILIEGFDGDFDTIMGLSVSLTKRLIDRITGV